MGAVIHTAGAHCKERRGLGQSSQSRQLKVHGAPGVGARWELHRGRNQAQAAQKPPVKGRVARQKSSGPEDTGKSFQEGASGRLHPTDLKTPQTGAGTL